MDSTKTKTGILDITLERRRHIRRPRRRGFSAVLEDIETENGFQESGNKRDGKKIYWRLYVSLS